jgi:hypothetical protein
MAAGPAPAIASIIFGTRIAIPMFLRFGNA